jgi:hypothetical protein
MVVWQGKFTSNARGHPPTQAGNHAIAGLSHKAETFPQMDPFPFSGVPSGPWKTGLGMMIDGFASRV